MDAAQPETRCAARPAGGVLDPEDPAGEGVSNVNVGAPFWGLVFAVAHRARSMSRGLAWLALRDCAAYNDSVRGGPS